MVISPGYITRVVNAQKPNAEIKPTKEYMKDLNKEENKYLTTRALVTTGTLGSILAAPTAIKQVKHLEKAIKAGGGFLPFAKQAFQSNYTKIANAAKNFLDKDNSLIKLTASKLDKVFKDVQGSNFLEKSIDVAKRLPAAFNAVPMPIKVAIGAFIALATFTAIKHNQKLNDIDQKHKELQQHAPENTKKH